MSHRFIAHTGLGAAALVLTLAMGVLGRQAITRPHPTIEVGKAAPAFTLPDTAGHNVSLADFRGHPVVLFFGSDACPTSHQYAERLASLANRFSKDTPVKFIAINSNTNARAASIAELRLLDSDSIPTLIDPMAGVAASFGATVTPTFCVIDSTGTLRYEGSFDDGQPEPARNEQYLARAVERAVDGIPCEITSTQAFGRSIAWVR